jgi:predicted HAD superfamily phosphohydrolase YqeG
MRLTWDDIQRKKLTGNSIVLDIDGTILADGETEVSDTVRAHLRVLGEKNSLVLLTNSRRENRGHDISHALGIPLVTTPYKKPDPRIGWYLPHDKPVVCIGDKLATEGILSYFVGADFFLLKRVCSPKDRFLVRVTYWLDALLIPFAFAIRR